MQKSKIKKLTAALISTVMFVSTAMVSAVALEPYNSYIYSASAPVSSQDGYTVDKVVNGLDMGLEQLSDPSSPLFISENEPAVLNEPMDMFRSAKGEFYIVDNGNARVLKLDSDLKLLKCFKYFTGSNMSVTETDENGVETTRELNFLKNPRGVYVDTDDNIFIADYDNSRVIKCDQDGNILHEYTRPDSTMYTGQTFNPSKVICDNGGNLYVIVASVNTGACVFSPTGEFTGFFGANRVEVTFQLIVQRMWRNFYSDAQKAKLAKAAPVEYANFDIDSDGFIYTVTEVANVKTDAVKKMNAAGKNVWASLTDIYFGDQNQIFWSNGTTIQVRLTDVEVAEDGLIHVLDFTSGRVFQYDPDCNLLFIFGASRDNQQGAFSAPNAIESSGDYVYVLDGRKNDVTVFKKTVFGQCVHDAVELFNKGLYTEAIGPWKEVIKRDGNYNLAYEGIAKARYYQGDYEGAMEYAKIAFDAEIYDRAYKSYRDEYLRENFTMVVVIILLVIVLILVYARLKKKGIIKKGWFIRLFKKKKEGGAQ